MSSARRMIPRRGNCFTSGMRMRSLQTVSSSSATTTSPATFPAATTTCEHTCPDPKPRLQQVLETLQSQEESLDHLLKFPSPFVGSVRAKRTSAWFLCDTSNSMRKQPVRYVPALYKIFDELVAQVVKAKVREESAEDGNNANAAKMTTLDVTIDFGTEANGFKPLISVRHDGHGIPIELHSKEQVYTPELLVGQVLTKCRRSRRRRLGEREGHHQYTTELNLTNMFSQEFVVETADSSTGLKYKQVWSDNMRNRSEPVITTLGSLENDFTRLSFSPDLSRFRMSKLSPSMIKVLRKRVVELAGCLSNIKVTLNGETVPVSGFESYVKTFEGATVANRSDRNVAPVASVFGEPNDRWQIGVLPSDMGFVQVSFVNGIATKRGGNHVELLASQLCRRIVDHMNMMNAHVKVTEDIVKNHVALFVNCRMDNPVFDSPLRERLTTKLHHQRLLSDAFIHQVIAQSQIVERVELSMAQQQLTRRMASCHTLVPRARKLRLLRARS